MLPKFMPDLFQPITLLVSGWRDCTRARIRLGYRVNRSVQRGALPANDN